MSDNDPTRILSVGPNSQLGSDALQENQLTILPGGARTMMPGSLPGLNQPQRELSINAHVGNQYGRANDIAIAHVLFEIKALSSVGAARPPLNLCLCLDRSGSMEGPPLEYALRACDHVVDLLEPSDFLSIVTFSDQADIVMPARRVVNKVMIKDYIHRIFVGNTTNLYDGLTAAGHQIASAKTTTTVNRVLLLTDGEPTAGPKDFQSIVRLISDLKQRGITVTALGFGPDYNEELIAGIARRSGGNYYYISRPELLPEMFRRELQMILNSAGRNLTLRLKLSRGVSVRQVFGNELRQPEERTAEVTLPDVESGATVNSLWELQLDPHPSAIFRIGRAELAFEDTISGGRASAFADVVVEFTSDSHLLAQGVNATVEREIQLALATRQLDKTLMTSRTQQLDTKTVMLDLERTQILLIDQGRTLEAGRIEEAIAGIQSGDSIEKTLMGTVYHLEQGKLN